MDRHSFLESLPFLVPCSRSTDWSELTDLPVGPFTDQFLLDDHHLSIEIVVSDIFNQVIYFEIDPIHARVQKDTSTAVSTLQQDPTLTACTMAFRIARQTSDPVTPHFHQYLASPRSPSSPPPRFATDLNKEFVTLTLLLNDRVYFVNWTALANVKLALEDLQATPVKPPSLLLQFPSCVFRIFRLNGEIVTDRGFDKSTASSLMNQYRSIQSAVLRALSRTRDSSSVIHPFHSVSTPFPLNPGLALGSSSEDAIYIHDVPDSSSISPNSSSHCSSNTSSTSDPSCVVVVQHQQRAQQQCLDDLHSLWDLLLRKPTGSQDASLTALLDTHIPSTLTSIAQDVATILGQPCSAETDYMIGQLQQSNSMEMMMDGKSHHQENDEVTRRKRRLQVRDQLSVTLKEIDTMLVEHFPTPRYHYSKRARYGSHSGIVGRGATQSRSNSDKSDGVHDSCGGDDTTTTGPSNAAMTDGEIEDPTPRFNQLISQHKHLIREQYALLRLPRRY